jgi:hypothetical protein
VARYRVMPSKPLSAISMVVGIVFVGIGLFVVIPSAGAFGIFWTLLAGAIAVYHAINLFSDDGFASSKIIEEGGSRPETESLPFDERIRRLDQLRKDGLVTDDEYQRKRTELMNERW